MFLKKLKLKNYRNYPALDFEFKNQITVLVGDNAQGKSNFLESIYFLASTKSERASKEDELINSGQDFLIIEGAILQGGSQTSLEVALQQLNGNLYKKSKVNGVSRRMVEYSENLAVVLFSPEDVNLVAGSPSLRRAHIDQLLSQTHRAYKKALTSYENIVTRKNKLLKRIRDGFAKRDELDYWADQQIMLGNLISSKRAEFFEFINLKEKKLGENSFEYIENQVSLERLKANREKEIESATSIVGPHRDDFIFKLKGKDLSKFGSRGEQRTAVLDLKIVEVDYIEAVLNDRPVLLLDDIFSELDFSHRQHVIDLSKLQQTVIATVDWDENLKEALKEGDIFFVEKGRIKKQQIDNG